MAAALLPLQPRLERTPPAAKAAREGDFSCCPPACLLFPAPPSRLPATFVAAASFQLQVIIFHVNGRLLDFPPAPARLPAYPSTAAAPTD